MFPIFDELLKHRETHTHTQALIMRLNERKRMRKKRQVQEAINAKKSHETTSGEQFGRELEPRFILHRARIMLICGLIGGGRTVTR